MVEGSGGGEGSTGRGGMMWPEAMGESRGEAPGGGVGERVSWTATWLDMEPEMETRRMRGARAGGSGGVDR